MAGAVISWWHSHCTVINGWNCRIQLETGRRRDNAFRARRRIFLRQPASVNRRAWKSRPVVSRAASRFVLRLGVRPKCAPTVRDRAKRRGSSTATLNERAETGPSRWRRAHGAGVRKPSQQRNSQADIPMHFIKLLLQHKQLYLSPFAIFLSVAICRKKSLIGCAGLPSTLAPGTISEMMPACAPISAP